MRRLNAKATIPRNVNVKVASIVRERKLLERMMSPGEVLNFLNIQSQLWSDRDTDCIRYAFKKRLPDFSVAISSSESFLRGSLNTIANLDLGNDKQA